MVAVHRPKNDYCLPALDLSQEPRPIINFATPLNNYQQLERIRSLRFISWSMQCKMSTNRVRQLPNAASVLAIDCSIEISTFSVLKSKITERNCLGPTIPRTAAWNIRVVNNDNDGNNEYCVYIVSRFVNGIN